jgi:NTE family protein
MNASLRSTCARWFRAANPEAPETFSAGFLNERTPRPPKIGLALSSGGARGLAHVGVIQVFEKECIPVHAITGSSMGAYVGSLYAVGFNGTQLEELAREIKSRKVLLKLLDPVIPPSEGLIRGARIRAHLERSLGGIEFKDLATPLLVVATDLDSLTAHVFDSGPVAAAVHASAAIPGFCAPVTLDGHRYIDGGASDPLPVTLMRERFAPDVLIAVNVLPKPDDIARRRDKTFPTPATDAGLFRRGVAGILKHFNLLAHGNVLDTFRRSLMTAQLRLGARDAALADVCVHPVFRESAWYDFEHFDLYIEAGREAARAALPRIRALLKSETTKGANHETPPPHQTEMGLVAA